MAEIEITPDLLALLKRKAEAASEESEGHWGLGNPDVTGGRGLCVHDRGDIVARLTGRDKDLKQRLGEHISAADPATVLALVAEIERLQLMILRLEDSLDATAEFPGSEAAGE